MPITVEQAKPVSVTVTQTPSAGSSFVTRPATLEIDTAGAQGPSGASNFFVGPIAPTGVSGRYMWVQTNIGANNEMTIWIEDGR